MPPSDHVHAPTVLHALVRHTERDPDALAVRYHAGDGSSRGLGREALIARAAALADRLRGARAATGSDRPHVLLALPNDLEYVVAYLACGLAGATAVTYMPPSLRTAGASRAYAERLAALVADADPSVVVASSRLVADLAAGPEDEGPFAGLLDGRRGEPLDDVTEGPVPVVPRLELPAPDDLALLQYTSGSTSAPKGVMVSHANLAENTAAIARALRSRPDGVMCSWLPLFHDMGLIGTTLHPLRVGMRVESLSPTTFLRDPVRFLGVVSATRATQTVAPNFGWELVLQRLTPDDEEALDLSAVEQLMSGAEPIDPVVLEQLAKRLVPLGLDPRAVRPVYGLAEHTLMATGDPEPTEPRTFEVDATSLGAEGVVRPPAGDRTVTLVGCGPVVDGTTLRVVDPDTGEVAADGHVGEVWLSGPSVAGGYWRNPEATAASFGARLRGDDRAYLRTGDLGVVVDGSLCLVGRRKDVIIRNGVNHAPQDLERTAQRAHDDLRPGGGVAVALGARPGAERERIAIVHELRRYGPDVDLDAVVGAIRRAVLEEHGLQLDEIRLVRRGRIERTTSGKLRRRAMGQRLEQQDPIDTVACWTRRPTPEVTP